jgi:hypothetical protein
MGTEFPFGVMKATWNLIEVEFAQHCACTKDRGAVYFKMVNLMLCEFRLITKTNKQSGRQYLSGE